YKTRIKSLEESFWIQDIFQRLRESIKSTDGESQSASIQHHLSIFHHHASIHQPFSPLSLLVFVLISYCFCFCFIIKTIKSHKNLLISGTNRKHKKPST
ncbi:unnamed protein product, partial [Brassica oleracea]